MRGEETQKLTSNSGRNLLPKTEMALHSRVMAKKVRNTWYVSACHTPTPGSDSKTLTQATKNRVVPNCTARVMVMLPTT